MTGEVLLMWIFIGLLSMIASTITMCAIPIIVEMWWDMIDNLKDRRK